MNLHSRQSVTEAKLISLATRQGNILRDDLLGQGIVTLFGKPADQEDGGLEFFQRTTLLKLEFRLFMLKRGRYY